jgi:hypothetical protein
VADLLGALGGALGVEAVQAVGELRDLVLYRRLVLQGPARRARSVRRRLTLTAGGLGYAGWCQRMAWK